MSLNKKLLIILLLIWSIAIIIIPGSDESMTPSGWGAGIDYGRNFIVVNGHLPSLETSGTWQGLIVNYGVEDVFAKILFSSINIITGTTEFPLDLRLLNGFLFSKILLMPLFGVYTFHIVARRLDRKVSDTQYLFVFACLLPLASTFAMGPIAGVGGNNVAMATFILICGMLIDKRDTRKTLILIIILSSFLLLYHTWSLYFLIIFATLYIGSIIKKNSGLKGISFLGVALYFIVGAYLSRVQLLDTPFQGLIKYIMTMSPTIEANVDSGYLAYQTGASIYSYLQIISVVILLSFIAITFFYSIRKMLCERYSSDVSQFFLFSTIGLGICWLALIALGGTSMLIGRFMEPSIPLALISLSFILGSYELRIRLPTKTQTLTFATIGLVLICAASNIYNSFPSDRLGQMEDSGRSFTANHLDLNESIFSDFRLATPMISYGFRHIFTPDLDKNGLELFTNLTSIYYGNVTPSNQINKIMGSDNYYVMAGKKQAITGVVDPNIILKPAMESFQYSFVIDPDLNSIFANNGFSLYYHD